MSSLPAPPVTEPEFVDEPVTDADWAVMSPGQRALIQEALDALEQGEYVSHGEMKREFQRLREQYAR